MTDVLVEERTCAACGVGVRPESQYCYNCGASLDDLSGTIERPIDHPDLAAGDERPILMPSITSKDSSPVTRVPAGETAIEQDGRSYESASSLRRKTRTFERKPVEVIWEPATGPNVVLIIATVLLVLFSVAVIALALYYR
jgi:hypothetical protein